MNDAVPLRATKRWIKRIAALGAALTIGIPAAGYFILTTMDTARLTDYLKEQVREKTGRAFYIKDGMEVSFGLSPSLTLRQVALANPAWAKSDALLYADALSVRLQLLPLLRQEIRIDEITASGAKLALEKNASGKVSWLLEPEKKEKPEKKKEPARAASHSNAFATHIGPIVLTNTEITYADAARKKPLTLTLPRLEVHTADALMAQAELALEEFSGTLRIEGASLAELGQKPLLLELSLRGPQGASVNVDGKIKSVSAQTELFLGAAIEADTLAAFSPLAGSDLPQTEPLKLAMEITGSPTEMIVDKLEAHYDASEISGRARLSLSGDKPSISATLGTPSWRLSDKKPASSDAVPAQEHASGVPKSERVIPDVAFPTGALQAFAADVEFTAGEIVTDKVTLSSVMGHVVLKEGILQADPLQFKISNDLVKGHFAYNSAASPPVMGVDFSFSGDSLGALLAALDVSRKLEGGAYSGNLSLKGSGGSLHAMLPDMQGTMAMVVEKAVLKDPKLHDAAEFANLIQGKSRSGDVALTCALGKLNIKKGVGTPEYLVADTKHVRLHGEGTFDLPQELLALTFYPQPKEVGLSELSFPIKLKGSFGNPEIKPDKTQAAFSAAKMFSGSKKLRGLESLLGKGDGVKEQDFSGLHPCLEPVNIPQDATSPDASDVIDLKKEGIKEDFKAIEKDVRGLRDGLKDIFKKQ